MNMAKGTSKRTPKRASRAKKMSRDSTQLIYPIASTSGSSSEMIVQVDKLASNSNHRLYRQGRVYHCKVGHDVNTLGGAQSIDVYALADTWFLTNAWKMAKKTFNLATKEERESLASLNKAKWYDFRIDDGLSGASNARVIQMAPNGTGQALSQGEYDYSRVQDVTNNMRTFTLGIGNPTSNYNILEEYGNTFNEQEDPTTPSSASPYPDLPNLVKSTQEFLDLQEDGNLPPYDATGVQSNSMWVKVGSISAGAYTSTTSGNLATTAIFKAPLGMVRLRFNNGTFSDSSDSLHVIASAGDYRGIKAERM